VARKCCAYFGSLISSNVLEIPKLKFITIKIITSGRKPAQLAEYAVVSSGGYLIRENANSNTLNGSQSTDF